MTFCDTGHWIFSSFIHMHAVDTTNLELVMCPVEAVDSTQSELKDEISMNENAAYGKGMMLASSSESEVIAQQQTSTRDCPIVGIIQPNPPNDTMS